jgi:hypothetical protein
MNPLLVPVVPFAWKSETVVVTTLVESAAAGGVLTGLLKNIDASLAGAKFGEAADWEKLSAAASI